jgi:hypothetical protein
LPSTNITHVGSEPQVETPLQPLNVEPTAGVATSVSRLGRKLPDGKLPEHILPQFIPEGLLATVPVPAPVFIISITLYPGATSNLALMFRSSVIVTVQGPVPPQPPPLQPLNSTPAFWLVLNVTDVPMGNDSEQSVPQLMPAGVLLTVPLVANGPALVRLKALLLVSRK